jgi:hypothetical protein
MCFSDFEDVDPNFKQARHNLCQELFAHQDYIRDCLVQLNRRTRVSKTHPKHAPMATQNYLWEIKPERWLDLAKDTSIKFNRAVRSGRLHDSMATKVASVFRAVTKERVGYMHRRLR